MFRADLDEVRGLLGEHLMILGDFVDQGVARIAVLAAPHHAAAEADDAGGDRRRHRPRDRPARARRRRIKQELGARGEEPVGEGRPQQPGGFAILLNRAPRLGVGRQQDLDLFDALRVEFAIDISAQQFLDILVHGGHFPPRRNGIGAVAARGFSRSFNRSCNSRRARDSRLITVPMAMPSVSAASW